MVVKGLLVEFKFLAEEFYIYRSEDLVWKGRSMSSNIINKICRTLLLGSFTGARVVIVQRRFLILVDSHDGLTRIHATTTGTNWT